MTDCGFGGASAIVDEVNAKVCVEPLKEPEISSSTLILPVDDGVKLIHTVPFH
jgi:hypothetical protein